MKATATVEAVRSHGTERSGLPMRPHSITSSDEERFWSKVLKTADCWLWQACKTRGYGRFQLGRGRLAVAHRLAYELVIGPIPDGMTLHHRCENHACVKPWHLQVVTRASNTLMGSSFRARNANKLCCPKGHPYSGVNNRGKRICHVCAAERTRAYREKHPRRASGGREPKDCRCVEKALAEVRS